MSRSDDRIADFVVVMLFFFNSETSAASILYWRADRLRKVTGDERLRSQSEIDVSHHTFKDDLVVLSWTFTLIFT
jgi:DHA1 family multidrug resistance protein-like MFS transporter